MDVPLILYPGSVDDDLIAALPSELTWLHKAASAKVTVTPWFCCTPFLFQLFIHYENGVSKIKNRATAVAVHSVITRHPFSTEIKRLFRNAYHETIKHHSFTLTLLRSYPGQNLPKISVKTLKGDAVLMDSIRNVWGEAAAGADNHHLFNPPYILVKRVETSPWSGSYYSIHPHESDNHTAYAQFNTKPIPHTYTFSKTTKELITDDAHKTPSPPPGLVKTMFLQTLSLENTFMQPVMANFQIVNSRTILTSIVPLYKDIISPILNPPASGFRTLPIIATGLGAGAGIATGAVRIIHTDADISQVKRDEIVVLEKASLKLTVLLSKIKGLVTVLGGVTSHTALLAREYGIPSIMGVNGILKLLKTGDVITINGGTGMIYRGTLAEKPLASIPSTSQTEICATKILLDTTSPLFIKTNPIPEQYQGIGLIRGEIFLSEVGEHPDHIIHTRGLASTYQQHLTQKLQQLAVFLPQMPLSYKLTDFPQNDRLQLAHTPVFDHSENNPFLGLRGLAWSLTNPEFLDLELEVLAHHILLHQQNPFAIILPYVRSVDEVRSFKRIAAKHHIERSLKLKLFVSLDTPAAIFSLKSFADIGIDGFYVNCNHVTALTLGVDPENPAINIHYDQKHPALISLYQDACAASETNHLPIYFYGHSVNQSSYLLHELVHFGATGVVVPPQSLDFTHSTLAQAELERIR